MNVKKKHETLTWAKILSTVSCTARPPEHANRCKNWLEVLVVLNEILELAYVINDIRTRCHEQTV